MAQEMRGHSSFRSLAATYLAPIKDYLPHRDHHSSPYHHHHHHHLISEIAHVDGDAKKHSWTHFSSHRFSKRSYSDSDTAVTSTERIVLLPGWASRRYHAEPGLSNRASGTSQHFLFKGRADRSLQVLRMTLRCLFPVMSSNIGPQTHCY